MRARLGRLAGLLPLIALATTLGAQEVPSDGPSPVVRAVLFYSPTCPHCHRVMTVDLPPLAERFGGGLLIARVDVSTEAGGRLYLATMRHLGAGEERYGVPAMLVGERLLVGALEIPVELPRLVESGLAAGGIEWPPVPELRAALSGMDAPADGGGDGAGVESWQGGSGGGGGVGGAVDRFRLDPVANGLAVVVLLLALGALGFAVRALLGGARPAPLPRWVVPVLGVAGAGVAAYLGFVEVSGAEAVCGPVGDCNTVQQSQYARLFGVLPVGLLGVAGYLAIVAGWLFGARARPATGRLAFGVVWIMAAVATAFSAYLTFLEPFVIGATCAWCLASALISTLILLAATPEVAPLGPPPRSRRRARPR